MIKIIIYNHLHKKLYLNSLNGIIERQKVYNIIARLYHIKKEEWNKVINEIIDKNMIERINQHKFRVREPIVK